MSKTFTDEDVAAMQDEAAFSVRAIADAGHEYHVTMRACKILARELIEMTYMWGSLTAEVFQDRAKEAESKALTQARAELKAEGKA